MTKITYVIGCDVSKRKVDVAPHDGYGKVLWYDIVSHEEIELAS